MRWKLQCGDICHSVELLNIDGEKFSFAVDGEPITLSRPQLFPFSLMSDQVQVSLEAWTRDRWRMVSKTHSFTLTPLNLEGTSAFKKPEIKTQMPGRILKILVKPGELVKPEQTLVIMEAMKMENEIRAEGSLKIKSIHVEQGQSVETGSLLISFESK